MPVRYAEAPRGQREEPCEPFAIPNTRVCANVDTLIFLCPHVFSSAAKSVLIRCYAFNKTCRSFMSEHYTTSAGNAVDKPDHAVGGTCTIMF